MKLFLIGGARPNFMKIAPIYWELVRQPDRFDPVLVHTGQHYDDNMSATFFRELNLPDPDYHFDIGSGSHGEQTSQVILATEKLCEELKPDCVVVVGDVNSTMAATIAAVKLGIPVAHVEAGLRSGDRAMPEEINRLITDSVADLLLTPSRDANENLKAEGVSDDRIAFVGNVMIDSLVARRDQINGITPPLDGNYAVLTLHRPVNVDSEPSLMKVVSVLESVANLIPLVFPVHPRTSSALKRFGMESRLDENQNIHLFGPTPYIEFLGWVSRARLVITDSGGIQEETTYLKVPCLTLRESTERPITILEGTNRLVELDSLEQSVVMTLEENNRVSRIPEFWDGKTGERIVEALTRFDPA